MGEQKNLILALVLMMIVMTGYQYFVLEPQQQAYDAEQQKLKQEEKKIPQQGTAEVPQANLPSTGPVANASTVSMADALADTLRVQIETAELKGSLSLRGAIIDDLSLVKHREELAKDSPMIRLLTPKGVMDAKSYYVRFGWADNNLQDLVSAETVWTADKTKLTPDSPVTLTYVSASGVTFQQKISVDQHFMFTVEQTIKNGSDATVAQSAYGKIDRQGPVETAGMFILHEGPIAAMGPKSDKKKLFEEKYEDVAEDEIQQKTDGGWMGFTDKYWMTALIPDQTAELPLAGLSKKPAGYQADYYNFVTKVPAGGESTTTNRFFAGAKVVELLNAYEEDLGIELFSKAIDWGWYEIITRPFYWAIHFLFGLTGNFGVAILLFTVLVKLALFPMANKQYISMAHMKKMQPKIKRLQERYKDDKMKLQQEMMALYKKEKINPMAGCLPVILQIPIFFSLYKVLYVTIDMRHQPFFGWIKDMSAPDPLTPVNLFGLIPWDPPSMIAIGILPILMGITMWLQQKMSTTTQMDPAQQKIMGMLPIVFTFILANFAAGLVLYWTWNSVLSILQQWVITRRVEAEEAK